MLFTEAEPAIYVYHQEFAEGGKTFTRRGFMGRVRLERFGEGNIHPHEETHGGAKADRFKLWKACRANLSQIFGLYPDPENAAQNILEAAIAGADAARGDRPSGRRPSHLAGDRPGVDQRGGRRDGRPARCTSPTATTATRRRCNLRDDLAAELAQRGEELAAEHPANFVLMMCVSMSDAGMLVLPTHRLFRGLPPMTADELARSLATRSTREPAGEGPERAPSLWDEIEAEGDQGTLGLYTAEDDRGRSPASPTPGAARWPRSPPTTAPTGRAWA